MRKLSTFLHIIDATSEWSGKIASFILFLIIGIMIWWVLLRYVFHLPTSLNFLTATKLFFIYGIFGAAYILRHQAHANTDILHRNLSLRTRSIVDLATSIFFFLFCIALLWVAIETAVGDAPKLHLSLRSFLPPNWPGPLMAPVGIALFLLQGLAKFTRDLITAITGKEIA